MNLTLKRLTFSPDTPTYGMLFKNNVPQCLTLERPWLNNKPELSCIPAGAYGFIPHNTPAKPRCWEAMSVPGRSDILIHAGNSIIDSLGCILVGMEVAGTSILKSQIALDHLRTVLPPEFNLTIINP